MNNKIRIYDLARKLNKSNKELLSVLQQLDIPVKSHSSSIDEETAQIVENILSESGDKSGGREKNPRTSHPSASTPTVNNNPRDPLASKADPSVPAGHLPLAGEARSTTSLIPTDKEGKRGAVFSDDPSVSLRSTPTLDSGGKTPGDSRPPCEGGMSAGQGGSVSQQRKGSKYTERPPIITVMGHVDHGKTTLLDNIRHSSIAAHEAGGITQHIGAYVVRQDGKDIVFLDTPGHEAFTEMRARGASVTDIVILVIGADDGVMPQTREAINHIKAAGVPLVVAINKIDKQGAKPDRVRQQLSELGIFTEGWGGEVGAVEISAKQGIGVPDLLERVLLEAEMQELKGNPDASPEGVVIEARLDKGKGPVATVIVKDGTLKAGDIVLFSSTWGKTRALFDWAGKGLKSAGPSTPVEILGLDGVPNPGEAFRVVKTEREARDAIAAIRSAERDATAEVKKASFEDLYSNLEEGQMPHLNLVVKCDVQGSLEALCASLEKLATNEVGVSIVHRGVGRIAESDVMLASASSAVIVGFNVRPDGNAKRVAELNGVEIRTYSVIYDVMDDVKAAMSGLLKPVLREDTLGEVEVRKLFRVPKVGTIAGSHVTRGVVKRTAKVRVIRDGVVIWDGKIASLRHEKDEAKELRAGNDCGISLEGFQDFREGDILEVYDVVEEKRTL